MDDLFLQYNDALALKELGFNKPCFGFYTTEYKKLLYSKPKIHMFSDLPTMPFSAPLYSQAFEWFIDNKMYFQIAYCEYAIKSENAWSFTLDNPTGNQYWQGKYNTFKEAELACLKSLIDIMKKKKEKKLSISDVTIKIMNGLTSMSIKPKKIDIKYTYDNKILCIMSIDNIKDFNKKDFEKITGISEKYVQIPENINTDKKGNIVTIKI